RRRLGEATHLAVTTPGTAPRLLGDGVEVVVDRVGAPATDNPVVARMLEQLDEPAAATTRRGSDVYVGGPGRHPGRQPAHRAAARPGARAARPLDLGGDAAQQRARPRGARRAAAGHRRRLLPD